MTTGTREVRIGCEFVHSSAYDVTAVFQVEPAPNQLVTLDIGTTLYGSEIKDSPIVGRSSSPAVRAGYLYRF